MDHPLQKMIDEKSTHGNFYNLQAYSENEIIGITNRIYLEKKHHLLFTDGSFVKSVFSAGYGIHLSTKEGDRFNFFDGEIEYPLQNLYPTFAQMYFEDIALNKGLKECARLGVKSLIVFLDSKNAYRRFYRAMKLNKLKPLSIDDIGGRKEIADYVTQFEKLWAENRELYYQLSIQKVYLIRGHANIYGNHEADLMAKKGRIFAENALVV